jgi:uncharacterized protein (DUF1778 family)
MVERLPPPPPSLSTANIGSVNRTRVSNAGYKSEKVRAERGETISLRASGKQKALIDRAAQALGKSRSDFMLDVVCREAESVLLDRSYFALSGEAFERFTRVLDNPTKYNPRLRLLLQTKPPWDR